MGTVTIYGDEYHLGFLLSDIDANEMHGLYRYGMYEVSTSVSELIDSFRVYIGHYFPDYCIDVLYSQHFLYFPSVDFRRVLLNLHDFVEYVEDCN